jgi:hypothetical protein
MLRPHYVAATETQLRWLRWGQTTGTQMLRTQHGFSKIAETYEDILRTADTYCMERQFAGLIEEARLTVPDDIGGVVVSEIGAQATGEGGPLGH